jgi:hypothetical protein
VISNNLISKDDLEVISKDLQIFCSLKDSSYQCNYQIEVNVVHLDTSSAFDLVGALDFFNCIHSSSTV